MQETLRRMREQRATGDRGFTLIELLVVVVIIGVLVGIAVPVYMNYSKGAANKSAQSDVRTAITAVEQYYSENGNVYPADANGTGANITLPAQTNGSAQTITLSSGNTLKLKNNTTSYVICAQNASGKKIYVFNSANGGSVKESAKSDIDTCLSSGS
ncbi:type II secretion system protein [Planosporangium sp. 12N6]|uniref:type II secretion system protein n=1 Tax=Planosporangium spinosum TaxID=3402278 RepID=UPI003CF83C82